VDVLGGPVVVLSGAELGPLDRQLRAAVGMFRRSRPDGLAPFELVQLAIAVNGAVNGSAAEPWNPPDAADVSLSDQPATFLVKEAAERMGVSGSWVRRLVRHRILETCPGRGPTRIYADSVAAHLERRRRKQDEQKAA
jgi:hypothetical protein